MTGIKKKSLLNNPFELTLDNIQYIINKELKDAMKTFNATGGAAVLMNVQNGDLLSIVSLPNFDINKRLTISDKKYLNKITRSMSLDQFLRHSLALAIDHEIVVNTILKNIQKN